MVMSVTTPTCSHFSDRVTQIADNPMQITLGSTHHTTREKAIEANEYKLFASCTLVLTTLGTVACTNQPKTRARARG
jgi:hypothetical protein